MKIQIRKSADAQHYWVLLAANGEPLATSETYTTRQACRATAEKVSEEMYRTKAPVEEET